MSSENYFKQIALRCSHIAREASDADGFVSVRRLLERVEATLIIRPLLVEGMIASSNKNGTGNDHRWCLLLDRETHNVTDEELANERITAPLSSRFRNTVAHELAHSLSFHPKEFGVEFPVGFNSHKTKAKLVSEIERHTEMLSPLLLLPDALIERLFSPKVDLVPMHDLCSAVRAMGVSRYVFVNRIRLLDHLDSKRIKSRECLFNFALGIGEWLSEKEARLKEWPLFSNFEGGKVPGFLFQLQKKIPVPAASLFSSNTDFYLAGGTSEKTEVMVSAGTPRYPDMLKLPVQFTVEACARRKGSEFLFTVKAKR